MKRDLQSLYIKYHSDFRTLSKIALSQMILKIIYLNGSGITFKQIVRITATELGTQIEKKAVEESLSYLVQNNKAYMLANECYVIHKGYKEELKRASEDNDRLHEFVLKKYFSNPESGLDEIKAWFQDSMITFFERYSYEWFHHRIGRKKEKASSYALNLDDILEETLSSSEGIL
jgi:hypothetical protein